MDPATKPPSPRQEHLLEAAYRYVIDHGLADISLRPLAAAIGSSPRVLLYLYGSKEGLIRALLERARAEELTFLERARENVRMQDLASVMRTTWEWLAADEHRNVLTLWLEAYARSLIEPSGPWSGFARATVDDWLQLLAEGQERMRRRSAAGAAARTAALAVLRGALLDLLATGDRARTTAAVEAFASHQR